MNKSTKKGLIAAFFLVTVGVIVFAAAMTAYHWDFSRLNTGRFETNTYEIKEKFSGIKMNVETADIIFAASDDNMCKVVCYEKEKMKHSVSVQDGTLTVNATDDREWYEHIIDINFHSPKVTVYLPISEYESLYITESTGDISIPKEFAFGCIDMVTSTGDIDCRASTSGQISIKTSTGSICLEGLSAGELDLAVSTGSVDVKSVSCNGNAEISVSTGKTNLTDVSCRSINSNGSTGAITLINVVTEETIAIERSTGDVRFKKCDAGELKVSTNTGDVTGSLLSSKVFITHSDTGRIDVPETTSGGKCKITSDTGDIRIKIV